MLEKYKEIIDEALLKYLNSLPGHSIYDPIKYIVNLGGKRFRSSLTLLAADLYGGDPILAIKEAMAIELFHNFTLVHDDIMDEATLRRGKQTVHEKWSRNDAILSGDLLYALVNQILAESKPSNQSIHSVFHQTAIEVCEGQSFDMIFEEKNMVSEEEYLNMIKLKTAVLVACALKMGGMVGGASEKDAHFLYNFGINLGIAFQIHDDILDAYPIGEKFGKKIGGDILEKKKTLMFISMLNQLSKKEKIFIESLYKSNEIEDKEIVNEIKALYSRYGVLDLAIQRKDDFHNEAVSNIMQTSLNENSKGALLLFTENLMNRNY